MVLLSFGVTSMADVNVRTTGVAPDGGPALQSTAKELRAPENFGSATAITKA
jgi:hypothetical protein